MCPARNGQLTTPAMRRLPVDDNGIPTGERENWNGDHGATGPTAFDDGFDGVPEGAVFSLAGGDRRIDVTFEKGYPAAQIFAPTSDDVVVLRADGRADRFTAPRRLPLCGARKA